MFEIEIEDKYETEIQNGMTCIDKNKVNKWSRWNLLHDTLNTPKRTKKLNRYYFNILQICMNTQKGKGNYKTFESYFIVDAVPKL